MIKVGDEVWYRGGWGRGPIQSATLIDIELTELGEKYGTPSKNVPSGTDDERWVGGVCLSDGETKWGYGYQIKPKTDDV